MSVTKAVLAAASVHLSNTSAEHSQTSTEQFGFVVSQGGKDRGCWL